LTYGAFVAQILNDYEHADEVNKQLDKMFVVFFFGIANDLIVEDIILACV